MCRRRRRPGAHRVPPHHQTHKTRRPGLHTNKRTCFSCSSALRRASASASSVAAMQFRMAAASIVGKLSGQLSHQTRFAGRRFRVEEKARSQRGGWWWLSRGPGPEKIWARPKSGCGAKVGRGPEMAGQMLGRADGGWRADAARVGWVHAGSRCVCPRRCQRSQPTVGSLQFAAGWGQGML